jgi:hypothetical protein
MREMTDAALITPGAGAAMQLLRLEYLEIVCEYVG